MKLSKKNREILAKLPVGSYQAIATRQGIVTLRCEMSNSCHGCAWDRNGGGCLNVPCNVMDRPDHKAVVFILEETLP